jgi:D-alanyl-D-alanine carboxypeptidase/D-alanyl-D-alanine-endopeptidase (penicillin-binding protein 4)
VNKKLRAQRKILTTIVASFSFAAFVAFTTANIAQAQTVPAHPAPSASHGVPSPKTPEQRRDNAAANRFSSRVDVALSNPSASKGEWGLLIVDAATGETLYALNEDKYFVPASNMKLFSTALALSKLGVDYKFQTTLETRGTISDDGTLSGDLFLVGRGDPNLSNRKFPFNLKEEFDGPPEKVLADLADKLAAKGVKQIKGDVVGDDSYFPREPYPDGWEIGDMVWEYGAAISAIVLDDNTATLTLTPGALAGDPVKAEIAPATPDFYVENDVVTSAAEVKSDITLTREPGAQLVVVRGTLPANSTPRKLTLGVHEPAMHAAAVLQKLLTDRGIKINGNPRAMHIPEVPVDTTPRAVLAEHISIPLGDSVKLVNKISQNLHTEMLLRTAARQSGLWAKPEDLMKFPLDFYAAAGIAPDDVIQTDGSGLSRHDLVTPRALVALLKYAQTQPWFNAYFASLPVAGIDGTLEDRMKNTIAVGRIHAKTGSVEHVRTRSGFAETSSGRTLIFSFLSNNQGGKIHEATDALDAISVAMIEEFDVKPQPPPQRVRPHTHPPH